MKEDKKTYREYTAYPEKYKGTYWGNFASIPQTYIVENRNRFITDYDIKKNVKHSNKYYNKANKVLKHFKVQRYLDHYELYSLNNSENLLAVISPYEGAVSEIRDKIIADGWTEIYPIYGDGAVSFILYI